MVALCALACSAFGAQELRAIAEDGRKVLLSPDGRWRFDSSSAAAPVSADSGSPYQTSVKKFSLSFGSDWTLSPKRDGEANKRMFLHKSLPLYGMVIADEIPATTATMRGMIVSNMRSASANTTVLLDGSQEVAGKEVGNMRLAATLNGLDFVFSSNYYADGDGNVQATCWTAQSLFFKYQAECQKFISGLIIK
jgi:hypothetical protein